MPHFKRLRKFEKAVKPYGLTLKYENHVKVIKNGTVIYSMSLSPTGAHACEASIRDLVRMGHLPSELKRLRIR